MQIHVAMLPKYLSFVLLVLWGFWQIHVANTFCKDFDGASVRKYATSRHKREKDITL